MPTRPLGLATLTLAVAFGGCAAAQRPVTPDQAAGQQPVAAAATKEAAPAAAEPAGPRREAIADGLWAREILPKTWVITDEHPMPANSLVVEAPTGQLLLVDTPWTPAATEELLRWLDRKLGPRKKQAVFTHFHLDALGGNAALMAARVGSRGLVTTAELLAERGEERYRELLDSLADRPEERARLEGIRLARPGALYMAGRFGLPLGESPEEGFELIHPGPAHSPDNLAVYFPQRKLLFGGCMVKGGKTLGFLGDADLERWPDAIRQLQKLGAEIVVPGHGDRLDPGQLDHTLELIAAERSPRPAAVEP